MTKAVRTGLMVALILAVLTLLEYFFAVSVDDAVVRFVGLTVTALGKAVLILIYFMHFMRMFRQEEAEGWH